MKFPTYTHKNSIDLKGIRGLHFWNGGFKLSNDQILNIKYTYVKVSQLMNNKHELQHDENLSKDQVK